MSVDAGPTRQWLSSQRGSFQNEGRMHATSTALRSFSRSRVAGVVIALFIAALSGLAFTACSSDDSTTTATSTSSPEQAYAEGLANAARAVVSLGQAVTSGSSGEQTAADIRSATQDWESAISSIDVLDLQARLQGERDQLVEDSRAFVDAWNEVANEYDSSTTNGLLEIVQMRSPILEGITSLQSAIAGALEEAGSATQDVLASAEDQLRDALSQITRLRP